MKKAYPLLAIATLSAGALLLQAAEPAGKTDSASSSSSTDMPTGGPRAYEKTELTPIINRALHGGRNFEQGKKIMDTIGCRMCHLFNGGSGGIGPDLSGVGGRFGVYEILESILEPSAVVSDLYGTKIVTLNDGTWYTGRLSGQTEDTTTLITSYVIDPQTGTASWNGGPTKTIKNSDIWDIEDNPVSPMPPGMIDGLKENEIADFLAYLISGGNPDNRMFQPLDTDSTKK